MENLRELDIYFCKLSAKCQELFLYHGILNKSYSKLISIFLDFDFCLDDDRSFWERFISEEDYFEDWFRLVQRWKFWQEGDEQYLHKACKRLDCLCEFVSKYFSDDLPFKL